MKYFTPRLYLDFNSDDPDVVDEADRQWEEADRLYKKHLRGIESKLTPSVRKLSRSLCLHDADYLGFSSLPHVAGDEGPLAVLSTRQEANLTLLIYLLAEEPLIQQVHETWPFSGERVHWLYDEFSLADSGVQQHEILLSNGRMLLFRFHELEVITHQMHEAAAVA
jgi:hypothetical protein